MLNKCTSLSTLTCHITLQYFYVLTNQTHQTLYYIDYSLSLLLTYFTVVNRLDFTHIIFSIKKYIRSNTL